MDEFFQYDFTTPIFPAASSSAFIPYNHRTDLTRPTAGSRNNVNRRMVEFLRRSWNPAPAAPPPAEMDVREKGYKHMINERIRREKQKQSYSNLRALLPRGTKNDKNTIVHVAAKEVVEMERRRRELENVNREMAARLGKRRWVLDGEDGDGKKKIMLKVMNPCSGIDSVLEALRCLKNNGFKAKSIQSNFSNNQISAVLDIFSQDKKIEEAQLAIQQALIKVEKKFTCTFSTQELTKLENDT